MRQNTTLAFQQDLLKIGVELKPTFLRAAAELFGAQGAVSTGDFDVAEFAYTYQADPGGFYAFHSTGTPTEENSYSGDNNPRWKNDRNDELITIATNSLDADVRAAAYAEQQALVNAEAPQIGLYVRPNIHVSPTGLKNFKPTGHTTTFTWNSEEWFLAR